MKSRDQFFYQPALLGCGALAFFDNGAGDAVLAGFLFYEAVVLCHAFGRALGFDFGRGCIHVTCSLDIA